jgi:hypothetical protein
VLGCLFLSGTARVQAQTATQVVTFRVVAQSHASVGAPPAAIPIRATSASVGSASYAITTNEANQKITGALDEPMPGSMTLAVSLAAPAGAVSAGSTTLHTVASDLVTGISPSQAEQLPMEYTMSAVPTRSDGHAAGERRMVTYTVLAAP